MSSKMGIPCILTSSCVVIFINFLSQSHANNTIQLQKAPCALALELYKKPTDWKRKSLKLFTVKELYMHVSLKRIIT